MTTLVDHLAQGLQGSSHFSPVLEHQGNTQDLLQHLEGSPLVLGYQDSILRQELQGSSPPVLELLGSSLAITHLKELLDSYQEALSPTQPDHLLLALELHPGLIQMCLTQEVSQEEAMGCTDRVVQVHTPLQLVLALSLLSLLEAFLQYPLGHGGHMQVEASLLLLAPLLQGLWVHTAGLLLPEACW